MGLYRVTGRFRMGRDYQPFAKEVEAAKREAAGERVLSILGSKHRVKRREIVIVNVEEVKQEGGKR